jgi:hypothetical protein
MCYNNWVANLVLTDPLVADLETAFCTEVSVSCLVEPQRLSATSFERRPSAFLRPLSRPPAYTPVGGRCRGLVTMYFRQAWSGEFAMTSTNLGTSWVITTSSDRDASQMATYQVANGR